MMIKAKEPAKGKQSELFYPEAGGCTLLWNVGGLVLDYAASCSRR
jgi:hypothetical protein